MSFSTYVTAPVKSPFLPNVSNGASGAIPTSHHSNVTVGPSDEELEEDLLRRMNGHFFKGQKQELNPHGLGEYVFRNGTIYNGQFCEGMFDGAGTLTFPNGARFVASWIRGKLIDGQYYFDDKLEYQPKNWPYCTDADRRFWTEQQFGIQFEELPQLTDSGEQNTKSIPYGTYDMGDCYLDPKDNKLYNYDGLYYRDPTPEELAWAKRKARLGLDKLDANAAKHEE